MSLLPPSFVFPPHGRPTLVGKRGKGHRGGQGWVWRDLKPVSDSAATDKFNGDGAALSTLCHLLLSMRAMSPKVKSMARVSNLLNRPHCKTKINMIRCNVVVIQTSTHKVLSGRQVSNFAE